MKNIRRGFVLLMAVLCLATSSHAQEQKFADIGDFKLVSGETLRNARIGYRTFGKMNADRSNIVVFPTWAGGTTEELKDNVGAGKLINDADYYVILIDALANGVSSSPSNSTVQPHMKFPGITVRDMVNTEHELLTKKLDINHVKAVMGISMGGMQIFQWMVSYPGFMDKAIPIVGSPHVAPYDVVMWRLNIDALKDSAGWNHGDYTENPAKLVHFEIGELMLQTPTEYNRQGRGCKQHNPTERGDVGSGCRGRLRRIDAKSSRGGKGESPCRRFETGSHGDASARPQFCGALTRAVVGIGIRLRTSRAGLRRDEISRGNIGFPAEAVAVRICIACVAVSR
jgi:hypothetical protein